MTAGQDGMKVSREFFQRIQHWFWPVVGVAAAIFAGWLLYRELQNLSVETVWDSLAAIPPSRWALAVLATIVAYAALAEYDRIALIHLNRKVPWPFVMLASFSTYALSHNIGASLLSGAVIRLRAYGAQGLTTGEIGVLVALTSFTFILGAATLGGLCILVEPSILQRFVDIPVWAVIAVALLLLSLVAFYALASLRHFKPLTIGGFHVYYPAPAIVVRQLIVGPLELIGAAAIIYFCLPEAGNPGFITILGVFVASFTLGIISHAPGGLGVIEFAFLTALPDMNQADVLAALIVFRLFYLIVPLALALVLVLVFERWQFARNRRRPG